MKLETLQAIRTELISTRFILAAALTSCQQTKHLATVTNDRMKELALLEEAVTQEILRQQQN